MSPSCNRGPRFELEIKCWVCHSACSRWSYCCYFYILYSFGIGGIYGLIEGILKVFSDTMWGKFWPYVLCMNLTATHTATVRLQLIQLFPSSLLLSSHLCKFVKYGFMKFFTQSWTFSICTLCVFASVCSLPLVYSQSSLRQVTWKF